jgi:diguanylate cyclase (GGDEF)-like protein/PAS domain S-box-containing protein
VLEIILIFLFSLDIFYFVVYNLLRILFSIISIEFMPGGIMVSDSSQRVEIKMHEATSPEFDHYMVDRLSDTQLIRTIMDNSQDLIYFKDRDSIFRLNSKAHAMKLGFDNPADLVGKSDADFYPDYFVRQAYADEQKIINTGKPIIGRIEKWEKPDGTSVWFSASKYPLYDDCGNIVGTWGTSRDITALKLAEKQLERVNAQLEMANTKLKELAIIDELSGLYNRRNFYDILQKMVHTYARRKNLGVYSSFCLVLIDIDHFKDVNDTYGHLIGDSVIRYVAHFLCDSIRASDYTFRYGGDEYAMILLDSDLNGARDLGERLRMGLEESPYKTGDTTIPLTISLGIASFENGKDAKTLVREADRNLYFSKNNGRNQVT